MEKEKVGARWAQFSIRAVHIIEGVSLRLDVWTRCIEDGGSWGRGLKGGSFGFHVVVVVLVFVVDLLIDIVYGVYEWIQLFLFSLFGSIDVSIVLLLLEPDLYGDATAVKVGLAV